VSSSENRLKLSSNSRQAVSVAMKLTGHKTEAVYRRYAIVAKSDLREAGTKLAAALRTVAVTASLSDKLGDNCVTARKARSLSG
jgi:hypothetical protein